MKVWSFDHAMNLTIKISDGFESGIGLFCRIQKPDFTILVMGLSLESDALEGLGPGFFYQDSYSSLQKRDFTHH